MKNALLLANLAVAVFLIIIVGLQATTDRDRVIEGAYQDAENVSNALKEHTRQFIAGIDLGLVTIIEALDDAATMSNADRAALHAMLVNRQEASLSTFAYFLLDSNGRVVATSRTPSPEPLDLSHLPEFVHHRDGSGDGLRIGAPRFGQVGHAEDEWIINLTRSIEAPDGTFAGLVAASVSLDYLQEFYDALRIGNEGALGLFNGEGTLVARSPFNENFVGSNFAETPLFRDLIGDNATGRFYGRYGTDGVTRLSAYRQIEGENGLVYVGLSESEVLSNWRQRMIFDASIGMLAFVLFAGGSLITNHYLSRRREWENARSRRLKLLADETADLVRSRDVDTLLSKTTAMARKLIGAHQGVTSLNAGPDLSQSIHGIELSDKYAAWRSYSETPNGSGIYRLVCERNEPMMLTQSELENHPAWRGFGDAADRHPPMRGWLAVPLVGQDGSNLGLVQLSDKEDGDFTEDDLHQLVQLANIAGVALENLVALIAREQALEDTRAAHAEIETIFSSISDAVYALDTDWRFTYFNGEAERLLQRRREDLLGNNIWEEFPEARETILHSEYHRAVADRVDVSFEFYFPPLSTWFAVRGFPHDQGLTVYFQDISLRIEAEERLRQSQKMDAIGQLTGGVAHDFNNLLTVILGNAESLKEQLDEPDHKGEAEMIHKAAERAAQLTHRLLAFARRQPLDPRMTNVNDLVADLEEMLRRTLGETIEIELVRGGGLWRAIVDPGELENAILNLAINARDAMPNGGRLTIETANMAVDQTYAEQHDIASGQYVMVAVSDTGDGMPSDVLARAFDPFFTTKDDGKGSGLGLSMVYGFARQTGGHAKIYSEPGEGTTVRLYLPRAQDHSEAEHVPRTERPTPKGSERVLVVEDDELVRRHTVGCLKSLGYQVTDCATGQAALDLLGNGETFDLLLTDVVLSGGVTGKTVATEAVKRQHGLKVLFMSGYTENAIVHHGRLDRGVALLGKPFRLADLGRKVRAVLDG